MRTEMNGQVGLLRPYFPNGKNGIKLVRTHSAQASVEEKNFSHVTTWSTTQLDFEDFLSKRNYWIT